MYFTKQNTKGFDETELALLNRAVLVLVNSGWEVEDACDHVNDNFFDGCDIDDLTFLAF